LRRPGCVAIVPLWSANRRVHFKPARKKLGEECGRREAEKVNNDYI
jgi:hypothetical protein